MWNSSLLHSLAGLLLVAGPAVTAPVSAPPTVERSATHPMRYHLALPEGWTAERMWPVVVVIPDATRDFAGNLNAFVAARGARPFILVAPEVMTCGGARSRLRELYACSDSEWTAIDPAHDFEFDDTGMAAVLADVARRWHGERQAFLTGWEAGGHTVWAQALQHPERWRAVAPVSPNFQGRGLGARPASAKPVTLPLQVFRCGAPTGIGVTAIQYVDQQIPPAVAEARARGITARMPVKVVAGADHGPLPGPVLDWFATFVGH